MKEHRINEERKKRKVPPANYLLVRGAGNRVHAFPSFTRIWGIERAVCIAEPGVMKATCMLAGFDAVTVPELDFKKTLDFIFEQVESLIGDYPFVYAHIKGPDEPAHDGSFSKKRKIIERIDSRLEAWKDWKRILVVTCDHITSWKLKKHVRGPVPVLVYGKGKDAIKTFDEFVAKRGKQFGTGKKLLEFIFST
jgi:2,3-bisphosphoglycerate-independent phosphoglycerate mutase